MNLQRSEFLTLHLSLNPLSLPCFWLCVSVWLCLLLFVGLSVSLFLSQVCLTTSLRPSLDIYVTQPMKRYQVLVHSFVRKQLERRLGSIFAKNFYLLIGMTHLCSVLLCL